MTLKNFKEELRARVTDYAVSGYLVGINHNKTLAEKDKEADEMYQKLENWILNNIPDKEVESINMDF